MRKLLVIAVITLGWLAAQGQAGAHIICEPDPFEEGQQLCYASGQAFIIHEDYECAFGLTAYADRDGDVLGVYTSKGLATGTDCREKSVLILSTEAGESYKLHAWQGYNCKGVSYFALTAEELEGLRASPLVKVGLLNGADGTVCVGLPDEGSAAYLQEILSSVSAEVGHK